MYGLAAQADGLPLVTWLQYWDAFWGLPAAWRVASVVGTTVALAVVLVGLFPAYGRRGAQKACEHSIASTCLGSVVAALLLGSAGALYYGAAHSETVSLLAAPVLFVLATVAVVWLGIGLVALGEFLAGFAGRGDAVWGTVAAAGLVGLGAVYPRFGAAVLVAATLLGFGAGIRTNPFTGSTTERVVPPKGKA